MRNVVLALCLLASIGPAKADWPGLYPDQTSATGGALAGDSLSLGHGVVTVNFPLSALGDQAAGLGQLWQNDGDAAAGIFDQCIANSASPAGGDVLYQRKVTGNDNGGVATDYCFEKFVLADPTNLQETGYFEIDCLVNGTLVTALRAGGTSAAGPTGVLYQNSEYCSNTVNGVITCGGSGAAFNEDLAWNYEVSNEVQVTSSTGVTNLNWGSISQSTTAYVQIGTGATGTVNTPLAMAGSQAAGLGVTATNSDPGTNGILNEYYHNSASAAVADAVSRNNYWGNNAIGEKINYCYNKVVLTNIGDGTEGARVDSNCISAGADTNYTQIGSGGIVFAQSTSIDGTFSMRAGGTNYAVFRSGPDVGLVIGLAGDTFANNNLLVVPYANYGKDFDTDVMSPNPRLYVFSQTDPDGDNTQYIYTAHNQNHGEIVTGKGDIILSPFSDIVTVGTAEAGIDYQLKVDGETSDGTLKWMEDEAYWQVTGISSPGVGASSEIFGAGASSANNFGVALGASAVASGLGSIAIGYSVSNGNNYETCIGYDADCTAGLSACLGKSAKCNGQSVCVGAGCDASSLNAIAVGYGAQVGQANATVIGTSASNTGTGGAVIIGSGATGTATDGVAVGASASCDGSDCTILGDNGHSDGAYAVCLGADCITNGTSSIAIGFGATTAAYTSALAIGRGAAPVANNTGIIGSTSYPIAMSYTGNGTYADCGTTCDSHSISLVADHLGTPLTATMQVIHGADPFFRISPPDNAGTPRPNVDIYDTAIGLFANGTAATDPVITIYGETNNCIMTWYEDEAVLDIGAAAFAATGADLGDAAVTNVGAVSVDTVQADGTTVDYLDVNILELAQADLGATCAAGEMKIDIGGATTELCYCTQLNTWMCTALAAGPTD